MIIIACEEQRLLVMWQHCLCSYWFNSECLSLYFWMRFKLPLFQLNYSKRHTFIADSKVISLCCRVWRIFGYSNIFKYFPIRIFVRIIFVSFFWCEYIKIFIRIVFFIRIYSDIRSYRFLDINIFKYSFVSKIYIRHTLLRSNIHFHVTIYKMQKQNSIYFGYWIQFKSLIIYLE